MKLTTRRALMVSLCVLPALLLGALSIAQDKSPNSQKPQTSKQKFKNIKVLKDLPADQLGPLMRQFNTALNVRCDFCHVIAADHSGFEKDDKPMKDVARKMILMTNDINSRHKVIDKKATCYMCHQGHPEPVTRAPIAETR